MSYQEREKMWENSAIIIVDRLLSYSKFVVKFAQRQATLVVHTLAKTVDFGLVAMYLRL